MNRRELLFSAALAAGASLTVPTLGRAAEKPAKLRIGWQKAGVLLVAKGRKSIEKRLEADGVAVEWVEFSFGPPLLEALQAGAIDYGYTGNAPPVFAQAARADLVYVAAIPARGATQAIVVPGDGPLRSVAELRGKKVAVAKGSSAHDLLVAATEAAGLKWSDFEPVYLAPADAAAAFQRGAVDAWSIWDPYFALAEAGPRAARPLPIKAEVAAQASFFLANRTYAETYPQVVAAVNEEIGKAVAWADTHRDEVAKLYAEASGVPYEAQKRTVERSDFGLSPLTDAIVERQQAVADRFHRVGLIPKPIVVRDIVWRRKSA